MLNEVAQGGVILDQENVICVCFAAQAAGTWSTPFLDPRADLVDPLVQELHLREQLLDLLSDVLQLGAPGSTQLPALSGELAPQPDALSRMEGHDLAHERVGPGDTFGLAEKILRRDFENSRQGQKQSQIDFLFLRFDA